MSGTTRTTSSTARPRPRSSQQHQDPWDDVGLNPTETVYEADYETHSSILGPDGEPIPYQSKKLGHIGFVKLSER